MEINNKNFITDIIDQDLENKTYQNIITRFPPEPNGYLHIGHAKSICLNFGIAEKYQGQFNLRFDDTNPSKEEIEYIEAIKRDVAWLGADWGNNLFFASDYFEQLYQYALILIKKGKAYVCDLNAEQIREYRGSLTEPGKNSPYRNRSVEENLELFEQMKKGNYPDGSKVLRAKIDMSSPNINMRDPVMYRILTQKHPRTGDKWCIYPTYDFTHGQSDSIERISHSLCDLQFEDHRPLYNWFIEQLEIFPSRQIEFARLNLTHTVLSKRKLRELVEKKYVNGWDDPRMPTISGLKRRGFTSSSLNAFCRRIGVAKRDSVVDYALLEHCLREELNLTAPRVMAVLNPVKVIIDNYPKGKVEMMEAINNPEDLNCGTREIPFSRELYIEREDFKQEPPRKYFRLSPGREVRLKHAYYITCQQVIKDPLSGQIVELVCTYDPESKGGTTEDNRKVKGTLHWVSAKHAVNAQIRIYNWLFKTPHPGKDTGNFLDDVSENSLEVLKNCKVEPSLSNSTRGERYQFLRKGYFCVDYDSTPDNLIFNKIVSLKDTWLKIKNK